MADSTKELTEDGTKVTTTVEGNSATAAAPAEPSAGYGVTLVEVPAVAGKVEEMYKLFTEHPMGIAYTASMPGFVNMEVAIDSEVNSVILFEKWVKADAWRAYVASRDVENDANAEWNAIFGPLVGGAPRMAPFDCRKNYAGSAPSAEDGSYGMSLVEVPAVAGKLEEMYKVFTEDPMGLAYTASMPGFVNMEVAIDTEKNSIVLMEKWSKADDWRAYAASREVENEANAEWNATFGPLVGGAPRMAPMDCLKIY